MNQVVMDAELRAKLQGGTRGIEFVDETGNPIGHFMTHAAFLKFLEMLAPWPTKDEIAEARAEMLAKGGVPAEEVSAGLNELRLRYESQEARR